MLQLLFHSRILGIFIGEVLVIILLSETPLSSTISGLASPLLCVLISSAIYFQDDVRVLLGIAGQKIGKALGGSSSFLAYHVAGADGYKWLVYLYINQDGET